jgi:hypothetical protein
VEVSAHCICEESILVGDLGREVLDVLDRTVDDGEEEAQVARFFNYYFGGFGVDLV